MRIVKIDSIHPTNFLFPIYIANHGFIQKKMNKKHIKKYSEKKQQDMQIVGGDLMLETPCFSILLI